MFEIEEIGNGLMIVNVPEWVLWVVVVWAFLGMLNFLATIVLKGMNWRLNKELRKQAEDAINKEIHRHLRKHNVTNNKRDAG